MKTLTFREMISLYQEAAAIERLKCGRPCEGTEKNAILTVRRIVGTDLDEPVTVLTRQRIEEYILVSLKNGMRPVSVWGYLQQLKSITARWTHNYYTDRGFEIPKFILPMKKVRPARYHRPSKQILAAVKKWYENLITRNDRRYRIAAMMMLEFAMRNSDVARLTGAEFVEKGQRVFLSYTPNKTALSSGREVCWPVHEQLWQELKDFKFPIEHPNRVFRKLNSELRKIGIKGSKVCYELRKICIDHVYQNYGAEMATSISGDDIKTVTRYYADPAALNIENIRIVDLIAK